MATKGAGHRVTILQVSKEKTEGTGDPDSLTDWSRTTRAFQSDGVVLEKRDVRFRSDGRRHSYGWKKLGKMKPGVTFDSVRTNYMKAGWKLDEDHVSETIYTHDGTRVFE